MTANPGITKGLSQLSRIHQMSEGVCSSCFGKATQYHPDAPVVCFPALHSFYQRGIEGRPCDGFLHCELSDGIANVACDKCSYTLSRVAIEEAVRIPQPYINDPVLPFPAKRVSQRIEYFESDRLFLKRFDDDMQMLIGLVIEGVGDKPEYLLSPVWREMVVRHAKRLKAMRSRLAGFNLLIDNLISPLEVADDGDLR